jgi:predicted ATP-grasp superfamily ATP-dependent carboligase
VSWGKATLTKKLSVLLATSSASGTIAAVRNLGANGIEVGVVSSRTLSAASWSRWSSHTYRAPPESKSDKFLERLLAIGTLNPGQILLPTSDETAWLYTASADVLKRHFCVYQPSLSTILSILDKKLLAAAASKSGIAVVPSWYPRGIEDLEILTKSLTFPLLIKPRTHVHRLRNDKGVVVHSIEQLYQEYQSFVDRERARTGDSPLFPDAHLPILQKFVSVGDEGVLSVTGFIDRTGEHFVTRQATKVFQRSRPVGVGVCFESVAPVAGLADGVRSLCQHLGYFGIFEVEFLKLNGSWVMIDFNPRLYNQVGMDIYRGMPLPLLACLDAAGETAALQVAIAKALSINETTKAVFYDRFTFRAILSAQTLTARTSRKDRAYWRLWLKKNAANAVDAAADEHDRAPGIIHAMSEIYLGLKAFPRFLRSMPRRTAPIMPHGVGKAAS